MEEPEVSNLMCGTCKCFGKACKCIDHTQFHFARSCFSCDEYTAHHTICSAYDPMNCYPALVWEWHILLGGFKTWQELWLKQWHDGKKPHRISVIRAKAREGREFSDDVYEVPYDDFVNCELMKPDGLHYQRYRHIEKTRSSPIGYHWIEEGPGILKYVEAEK